MSPVAASALREAAEVLGALGRPAMPIGPLTTYRVGGAAALGVMARSRDDLGTVAAAVAASGLDVLVVGRGSNLLVADRGFEGIAVVLDGDAFATLDIRNGEVVAGAGLPLPALARRSVEAGLTGLEWAVGVPGSVGGGVRMNAGGHGSDTAEALRGCTVVDLSAGFGAPDRHWTPADLAHGYRRSALGRYDVVTSAAFGLTPGDPAVGRETIREIVRWRREHQPGGQNAGSVFVNPASPPAAAGRSTGGTLRSAGWLVESTGSKGLRLGSAEVSTKHANFIQADPGGSADDVFALMAEVRRRVADRWDVALHTEIRLVGFDATASGSTPGQPSMSDRESGGTGDSMSTGESQR